MLKQLNHFSLVRFSRSLIAVGIFSLCFAMNAGPVLAADDDLAEDLRAGKKTIRFSGKESGDIRIRKGVRVIGSGPSKAVINGDIEMENDSSLENVTVNGNLIPITIHKGASVTLENVTVRGGSDAGIVVERGEGGTLTIKDSRIIKNRKGMYVLPGKKIVLSGNEFHDNKEEGADLRYAISGSITGNSFTENGESGIELIVGGANLTISGNTFSGNKASGIALQTYAGSGKTGKISIIGNTMSQNSSYGMDCKSPSGGGKFRYFAQSVTARDNTITGNKGGAIRGACKIGNFATIEEEEMEEEAPLEEEYDVEAGGFSPVPLDALTSDEEEEIQALKEDAAFLISEIDAYNQPLYEWRRLLWGIDEKKVGKLEEELRLYQERVTEFSLRYSQGNAPLSTEKRTELLQAELLELNRRAEDIRKQIERTRDRKAFLQRFGVGSTSRN